MKEYDSITISKQDSNSNYPGPITDPNSGWHKNASLLGGDLKDNSKEYYFPEEDPFSVNYAKKKMDEVDKIRYMVSSNNPVTDDTFNNMKDTLKNNGNRIFLSKSINDIISRDSLLNKDYSDVDVLNNDNSVSNIYNKSESDYSKMILKLNNGTYSNYMSTPNYDKNVYDFITKLREKKIYISNNKVAYYENIDGKEKIYLDNGYVISLDNNGNVICEDYIYNTKYEFNKDKGYDLSSIKVCNNDDEIIEIDYDGNKTTVRDLSKEDKNEQVIYTCEKNRQLDYISLKNNEVCFSDGYALQKSDKGYEVVDRISIMNDVALDQVGNKYEKYSDWYNNGNGPVAGHWCAKYVSWLFYTNVGEGYINKGAGAGHSLIYGMKGIWIDINNEDYNGKYPNQIVYVDSKKDDAYTGNVTEKIIDSNVTDKSKLVPREGDLIFFNPEGDGEYYVPFPRNQSFTFEDRYCSGHVGYVYKVENGKVYTVEGNTGGGGTTSTVVSKRVYDIDDKKINGYFRPEY